MRGTHARAGRRSRPRRGAAGLALAVTLASSALGDAARADDRDACFSAYEEAQVLRNESRLLRARERLGVCSASACPEAIRRDCARWLDEIGPDVPSLVVEVRDPGGRDVTEVSISIDGNKVAERLDGKPIELDPGEHEVVCEASGGRRARERVVLAVGDRNRRLALVMPAASAPGPAPRAGPATPPRVTARRGRAPVPTVAWVLGGVAVASGAVGGYLAISGLQDEDDMRAHCRPGCAQDDIDALERRYLFADIGLGVAIVSAGAFAWLVLTRPELTTARAPAAPRTTAGPSGLAWRF